MFCGVEMGKVNNAGFSYFGFKQYTKTWFTQCTNLHNLPWLIFQAVSFCYANDMYVITHISLAFPRVPAKGAHAIKTVCVSYQKKKRKMRKPTTTTICLFSRTVSVNASSIRRNPAF